MSNWNYSCCVVNCKNNGRTKNCKFYKFPKAPSKVLQRQKWIAAVKRINPDGSQWSPKSHDVICNHHFIDKKKSDDPSNPSYSPILFPAIYLAPKVNAKAVLSRFNRMRKRSEKCVSISATSVSNVEKQSNDNVNNVASEDIQIDSEKNLTKDQACQVEYFNPDAEPILTFTCNRYIYQKNQCDAEVQTEIPDSLEFKTLKIPKKVVDKGVQYGPALSNFVDKSIGVTETVFEQNKKERKFCGFLSIKTDEQLSDIAGVNFATFNFLLTKTADPPQGSEISKEQRLLIFLVKMKTGLTFSAIGIFFDLHRTTASKIFYSTLDYSSSSTANLFFWPSKAAVQKTMPDCSKPEYSNTRVIIDCTEFRIDVPKKVDDRIFCYSQYKKGFTAKVLIGITPSGFICCKSKVAGGRKSDPQITIESRLIDLLEDGDIVLADKGFPNIRSVIDASGKQVFLIMPPFLEKNSEFSEEETNMTCSIARVRIHVERIMQRLRVYQILNKIPEYLFSSIDKIMHVACVLVNLQPSIFSEQKKIMINKHWW